ncbi:carbonic anhydrase family protein [Herbaspirillum chlorophenolicum]|uniref:Carbonic anhydrase n=1 Tax=Herbaspirillum chlorophenolicum TaxID=211589 RepID=A0ABW8EWN4_9BURK
MTHPLCLWQPARVVLLTLAAVAYAPSFAADTHAHGAPHFDYRHQEQWEEIHGDMQSPIAIDSAIAIPDKDDDEDDTIVPHNGVHDAMVADTGHALQVNVAPGQWVKIRGRRFALLQFHFHAASEHSIDGRSYPLEGHFVYKAKDGRLAVIAVMFQKGAANGAAVQILKSFVRGKTDVPVKLDAGMLLPPTADYYHYLGSLTTPPLSQNVEWYILARPMTMSASQLAGFKALYDGNNRKQQPLSGRPLLHFRGN